MSPQNTRPMNPSSPSSPSNPSSPTFLRRQTKWENLHFYQKANTLYQLTFAFTQRFLVRGDRTIDQMVQAARSGKQNIVEGAADGVTSMEMEVKLMNVARGSIKELREDYQDYLSSRGLEVWSAGHPRYEGMLRFCRSHDRQEDYQPFFPTWTDEEMANTALTLCHLIDRMMTTWQGRLEQEFVTEGGIRERMTAARLGYRTNQREALENQQHEIEQLRKTIEQQQKTIEQLTRRVRELEGLD